MTAPYKIHEKTREIFRDEVLISNVTPKNLKNIEGNLFNHQLIYLNPNYKGVYTPQNYRDWLDLIYESIHNPHNPTINTTNEGVKRATDIISFENISPDEWEQSKIEVGKRKVQKLIREEAIEETAKNGILKGYDNQVISDLTGLTDEQIEQLRAELTKE